MGTTANVYIKSDNKTEKFSIFMDGQYANLGECFIVRYACHMSHL